MGAVDWTAVGAIAAVLGVVGPLLVLLIRGVRARREAPRLAREQIATLRKQTADAYLTQLKSAAKAMDDFAAGRFDRSIAEVALNELSPEEDRLRQAFESGSAVHWIMRLNRGMLRLAFDVVDGRASSPHASVDDLVHLVDDLGFKLFEQEVTVALEHEEPVLVFASDPTYLRILADTAHLPTPQREEFDWLVTASPQTPGHAEP